MILVSVVCMEYLNQYHMHMAAIPFYLTPVLSIESSAAELLFLEMIKTKCFS